jgi:RND family efflux transporter MFP subunit
MRHLCRYAYFALAVTASTLQPAAKADSAIEAFTEPYRTVRVAAPESGIVTQLVAREGTQVMAGEALVRLDVDLHEALLAIAKAGMEETGRVEAAQAEVALRWQRVETLRQLREAGHARQEELDRAVADLQIAEGQLKTAKESLRLKVLEHQKILVQIERRTIRSPIAGVVTEVFKEPGEFTAANDPTLLTLVQLDPLKATFAAPQDIARTLHPGQPVNVELVGGTVLQAEVDFVSPVIDAKSNTVEVKVRIPNADGRLQGGMRCKLRP